jgi:hypothetical protein
VAHINAQRDNVLRPNVQHALNHLVLADCAHRTFMSKHELMWYVMQLPVVQRSFGKVDSISCLPFGFLRGDPKDVNAIVYTDRTVYSAYAERCFANTHIKFKTSGDALENERTMSERQTEVRNMSLREFAERVKHTWISNANVEVKEIGAQRKRNFRNRDATTGHWQLSFYRKRRHIRCHLTLNTRPAMEYEIVDEDESRSQVLISLIVLVIICSIFLFLLEIKTYRYYFCYY